MTSCLVIGAGIAGLMAARKLQRAGWQVTLLDKGNRVGGRLAHRQLAADRLAVADSGAQFFTVRSPIFQRAVDAWLEAGVVQVWSYGFGGQDGHPRYCGRAGMGMIGQHLAAGLTVHTQTEIDQIKSLDGGWQVTATTGEMYTADTLLLTCPVPQSLQLLQRGGAALPVAARHKLEKVCYHSCFAVLAVLAGESGIPAPGGVQVRGEMIDWIGDNRQKGVSARTAVTIHATPQFTGRHLTTDRDEVASLLLARAEQAGWLAQRDVQLVQTKLWRYAQPAVLHPERTLYTDNPAPLAFAGDAFCHARVEGAALSGLAAADALLAA